MDHELVLATCDDNQLEEVASTIGSGHQVPGWIITELEPGDNVFARVAEPRPDEDLFRLYVRAAQSDEGYNRGWILDQLCYLAPTGIAERDEALRRVFIEATRRPPHPHGMIDDNVDAHVLSARGLGRLGVEFPGDPDADDEARARGRVLRNSEPPYQRFDLPFDTRGSSPIEAPRPVPHGRSPPATSRTVAGRRPGHR